MSDLEHARLLIRIAARDLKALRGMLDPKTFDDEVFGFHAQQAVEKTLKGWLSFLGEQYPRTHDLEELGATLRARGSVVPDRFSGLFELTDFASSSVTRRAERRKNPSIGCPFCGP
ncbi:MAG: HEPN domain-containing protein [Acidobacteriia bacterium]|nr:HEPN domain-containing protein [Terriglobia bacterium]